MERSGWPGMTRLGLCFGLSVLLLSACSGSAKQVRKSQALGNQHFRLGLLNYQRGRYPEAIAELKKSIKIDPSSEQTYNLLGLVQLDVREYDEARKNFNMALKKNPYFTDAHNNLGTVYRKMGNPEKALEEFQIALEDSAYRSPEKVYYNIAKTLFEMERTDEAITNLETSIEIAPRYGKARMDLALAFKAQGRHAKAKEQLELIVQLIPDSQEAVRAQGLLDARGY